MAAGALAVFAVLTAFALTLAIFVPAVRFLLSLGEALCNELAVNSTYWRSVCEAALSSAAMTLAFVGLALALALALAAALIVQFRSKAGWWWAE